MKWLSNWINNPEKYHPKSLMPNLRLAIQDAADIASWLISIPGRLAGQGRGRLRSRTRKSPARSTNWSGFTSPREATRPSKGRSVAVPLSEVDAYVGKLSTDEKLYFLGEKTISRLGCFGCHVIPGFEDAKPIGTPLNDWGIKSPARLDFGHIKEYLEDQVKQQRWRPRRHQPVLPGASGAGKPDGLSLPEAAPSPQLRLPEGQGEVQDLGRPTADAPVRLGQRPGGRGRGDDLRPRADRREDRLPLPGEGALRRGQDRPGKGGQGSQSLQLHRLPRAGDAQVHDPRGNESGGGVHRLQGERPGVVHAAGQRLHPRALPRPVVRSQEEDRRLERRDRASAQTGRRQGRR